MAAHPPPPVPQSPNQLSAVPKQYELGLSTLFDMKFDLALFARCDPTMLPINVQKSYDDDGAFLGKLTRPNEPDAVNGDRLLEGA